MLHTVSASSPTVASKRAQASNVWPTRRSTASRCLVSAAKRQSRMAFEEDQSTGVGRVVEEATASSHGLFNDSFKSLLADTLSRQGTSALLQGGERKVDEHQLSGQEEVLKAAIMASKSTLLKLQLVKTETEKAIEIETKQVERLLFALEKARSDAAYYRTVQNILDDGPSAD